MLTLTLTLTRLWVLSPSPRAIPTLRCPRCVAPSTWDHPCRAAPSPYREMLHGSTRGVTPSSPPPRYPRPASPPAARGCEPGRVRRSTGALWCLHGRRTSSTNPCRRSRSRPPRRRRRSSSSSSRGSRGSSSRQLWGSGRLRRQRPLRAGRDEPLLPRGCRLQPSRLGCVYPRTCRTRPHHRPHHRPRRRPRHHPLRPARPRPHPAPHRASHALRAPPPRPHGPHAADAAKGAAAATAAEAVARLPACCSPTRLCCSPTSPISAPSGAPPQRGEWRRARRRWREVTPRRPSRATRARQGRSLG